MAQRIARRAVSSRIITHIISLTWRYLGVMKFPIFHVYARNDSKKARNNEEAGALVTHGAGI